MLITSHFIMFHVCFSFLPLLCAALVVVAVVAFAVAVTLLVFVAHVYFDIFYYRTSLFFCLFLLLLAVCRPCVSSCFVLDVNMD